MKRFVSAARAQLDSAGLQDAAAIVVTAAVVAVYLWIAGAVGEWIVAARLGLL